MFDNWAAGKQRKELEAFVDGLRGADSNEIAGVTALAYEWAEKLADEFGWNVFEPVALTNAVPESTFKLSTLVGQLQRTNQQVLASGLMVWVHSLRSVQRAELRVLGRALWSELERTFDDVFQASVELEVLAGIETRINRLGEFPVGLEPRVK